MSKVSIYYLILSNAINKKPFRLSKNGQPTNMFSKNIAEKEIGNMKGEQINFEKNKNSKINIKFIGPSDSKSKINADYEMDEEEK